MEILRAFLEVLEVRYFSPESIDFYGITAKTAEKVKTAEKIVGLLEEATERLREKLEEMRRTRARIIEIEEYEKTAHTG